MYLVEIQHFASFGVEFPRQVDYPGLRKEKIIKGSVQCFP